VSETTYLFIVGTGRCGSTLVQELIARHPSVGFVSNVDTTLAAFNPKGRANHLLYGSIPSALGRRDRAYLKELRYSLGERIHFGPSEAYRIVSRQISPTISEPFRDLTEDDATPWLADRFRTFFTERATAQGVPVFMHKFTGWPRARFIDEVMPNARFLHVVRDGRAVASSIVQRPWWKGYLGVPGWGFGDLPDELRGIWERHERSFVVLAGLEWRILMDAFDAAAERIDPARWLELRYEDIVEDPRGNWERILELAGLSWDADFDEAFASYPVETSRREAFRSGLTERQVEQLEDAIGGHLEARGYSLGTRSA
jgi:hypothetical protein